MQQSLGSASDGDQVQSSVTVKYFKLPYVGPFSTVAQRRLRKLVNQFCFDLDNTDEYN